MEVLERVLRVLYLNNIFIIAGCYVLLLTFRFFFCCLRSSSESKSSTKSASLSLSSSLISELMGDSRDTRDPEATVNIAVRERERERL